MSNERLTASDSLDASIVRGGIMSESLLAKGTYFFECFGKPKDEETLKTERFLQEMYDNEALDWGKRFQALEDLHKSQLKDPSRKLWDDVIHNTVVTVGKNHLLDNYLAASAFTQTGPFMGLISLTSFSAIAAGDTMASHAGWLEAGNANTPTYTSPRKTMAFSAASAGSKALSSALSYAITGTGTVKGAFAVLGASAVSTIDSTAGTLFSAGLFSGGDKAVSNGDTINANWSLSV